MAIRHTLYGLKKSIGEVFMFYNPYHYNPHYDNPYHYLEVQQRVNRFFEHIDGNGASFTLNSGDSLSYVGDRWNDRISSVRVAPRTLVVLYEHINFTGSTKILENLRNRSRLFNIHEDFNDMVSSIKTFRLC
ncbi:beta/gamma crystallin domain-containing protein [Brevibacillus sp. SKDU10]|uniref:beta/gamma crystallin domain-containing protein n=1 Tax=Brevibacillus sp. SKDU10 TaxID=1247872 RepID=UPI00350FA80C